MTTIKEVRAWIIDRYGPITEDHASGVYLAIVPVYEGFSVGMGARKNNAIYDLWLDLQVFGTRDKSQHPITGISFLRWEKRRHEDRVRSRVAVKP